MPWRRPRCILRYLTRLGSSIYSAFFLDAVFLAGLVSPAAGSASAFGAALVRGAALAFSFAPSVFGAVLRVRTARGGFSETISAGAGAAAAADGSDGAIGIGTAGSRTGSATGASGCG